MTSGTTAKYTKGREGKYADNVLSGSEDEDNDVGGAVDQEGLSISTTSGERAVRAGPFSALCPSICPKDTAKILQKVEGCEEWRWDEFGFRVEEEDGPEQTSSKILSQPFVEDPQVRLQWIAHLEFTHNQIVVEDLTWDKVDPLLPRSEKLASMLKKGIPHSLRPFIWPRLCGSILKRQTANFSYKEAVKAAQREKVGVIKQIEKDLLRTLPSNICFINLDSKGVPKLRRVLRGLSFLYPDIGYCQGMGVIVGSLLLIVEEEECFWIMATLIEDILPPSYFSASLLGLQADQRVLKQLVSSYLPDIERTLQGHDMELSLISLHWFLTSFSSVLHIRILVRIWDMLFYYGSSILFQGTLAVLKLREPELLEQKNSADMFNLLSELPGSVQDADELIEMMETVAPALNETMVSSLRKKQLALLMADQGVLINPDTTDDTNLPKQRVQRRKLGRSQSIVGQIFNKAGSTSGSSGGRSLSRSNSMSNLAYEESDPRNKNVHQTELLVDLKDSVLKVCRHFIAIDPLNHGDVTLQPDYSPDSHSRDHEIYLSGRRKGRKRARALLDFQRQEEDELGFRKNDIVTILSQRDEHCWVGELNGLRGWFPAKFVEVLDERGKDYSAVGDDAVTEAVTDLVRGDFCTTFKSILEHGMRKSILGVACHPWLFLEEVANREVAKDFESVYSRLVLCRTFRLDEDGKVLTPEELLYRSVQRVNATHDAARALMDVKLRSIVCLGLNEQALHLWFELICSSTDVVNKWYYPWSFISSPGWVQIKCDVRLLSQFCFNLNPDFELPNLPESVNAKIVAALQGSSAKSAGGVNDKPLKEGVRDMLVKHHLFSWRL